MRTTRRLPANSSRRTSCGVLAAVFVLAAAATAQAGDVSVFRAGNQVVIQGDAEGDGLVLSVVEFGVLHIEAADSSTTVNGLTGIDFGVRARDTLFLMLGDGDNTVDVDGLPQIRKLTVIGGENSDRLTIRGANVASDVLFLGRDGADQLEFDAQSRVTGDVIAVMGDGTDTFQTTQTAYTRDVLLDLGGGDDNTASFVASTLGSSVTVLGGDGSDAVTISGGSVRRLTQIDLGAGNDTLVIDAGARFGGKFAFRGGDDMDSVTVLEGSSFARVATFDLGRDDDRATFGLGQYTGGLRVDAGDGDDDLSLSEFTLGGRLIVQCGSGNDDLQADDSQPFVLSSFGGRIDGGAGRDSVTGGLASGAALLRFEPND